jgi:hypothetical protein
MTKLKAIREARQTLIALQAEAMAFAMHLGETVQGLHRAELALENTGLDERQSALQEILDAVPKFDPDNEVEPTRNGDEE